MLLLLFPREQVMLRNLRLLCRKRNVFRFPAGSGLFVLRASHGGHRTTFRLKDQSTRHSQQGSCWCPLNEQVLRPSADASPAAASQNGIDNVHQAPVCTGPILGTLAIRPPQPGLQALRVPPVGRGPGSRTCSEINAGPPHSTTLQAGDAKGIGPGRSAAWQRDQRSRGQEAQASKSVATGEL